LKHQAIFACKIDCLAVYGAPVDKHPVIIAGGGIAGTAAALALARSGIPAAVLEQSPAVETVGAGLQLGPNAVRALQWLGAWDVLEPCCVSPDSILIRDAISGAILQRLALGQPFADRFGAPYRVTHRADLLDALHLTARSRATIELHAGTRVTGLEASPGRLLVSLDGGKQLQASHVVGADGIRSAVRASLIAGVQPLYRGQAIYRTLLPMTEAPQVARDNTVSLWLGPGFHAVHYPVSAGNQLNIVVSADSPWTSDNWSEPASPRDLAAVIRLAFPALAELISRPAKWLKWAAADLPSIPAWHDRRTVLMGDAAHATLPYLAQGAAMALEDAVILARTWDDFSRYTALRRSRCTRIQTESRQMTTRYHASGPLRFARNMFLRSWPPERALNRMSWLYEYDPASA
jgi:salicylate hydroxylase